MPLIRKHLTSSEEKSSQNMKKKNKPIVHGLRKENKKD